MRKVRMLMQTCILLFIFYSSHAFVFENVGSTVNDFVRDLAINEAEDNLFVVNTIMEDATYCTFYQKRRLSDATVFVRSFLAVSYSECTTVEAHPDSWKNAIVGMQAYQNPITQENRGSMDIFILEIDNGAEIKIVLGSDQNDTLLNSHIQDGFIWFVGATGGLMSQRDTHIGGDDAFIAKVRISNYQVVWMRQFGTTGDDTFTDVTTDMDGNIYVTGSWSINSTSSPSSSSRQAVMMKLDQDGNEIYSVIEGDIDAESSFTSIYFDEFDHVLFIGGQTSGSMFGFRPRGGIDAIMSRFHLNGTLSFGRLIGSVENDYTSDVAIFYYPSHFVGLAVSTAGQLGDDAKIGKSDSALVAFDKYTGETVGFLQFGTTDDDEFVRFMFVRPSPNDDFSQVLVAVGNSDGAFGSTRRGLIDAFYFSIEFQLIQGCFPSEDGFNCGCLQGLPIIKCQLNDQNDCENVYCSNNATCYDAYGVGQCLCDSYQEPVDEFCNILTTTSTTTSTSTGLALLSYKSTNESSISMTLLIVLIAGGAVVFLCIITLVIVVIIYYRRKSGKAADKFVALQEFHDPLQRDLVNQAGELALDRKFLKMGALIGEGAFGEVREGTYSGKRVAVKALKPGAGTVDIRDFKSEVSLMRQLHILGGHSNLIRIVAYDMKNTPWLLVLEYMERGSLLNLLRAADPVHGTGMSALTLRRKALMIMDCLNAMVFLENNKLIHRDIAARNVLVSKKYTCKIADFGLAKDVYREQLYKKTTKSKMPFKWMALESLEKSMFTIKSDVWSFGVMMWEVYSYGQMPYPTLPNQDMLQYLHKGQRLSKPEECSDEIYDLLISCWSEYPEDRPTFKALRESFEPLIPDVQTELLNAVPSDYVDFGANNLEKAPPMINPDKMDEAMEAQKESKKKRDSYIQVDSRSDQEKEEDKKLVSMGYLHVDPVSGTVTA